MNQFIPAPPQAIMYLCYTEVERLRETEVARWGAIVTCRSCQERNQVRQGKELWASISYLWTYDVYGPVRNTFHAVKSITRASGRGLGPGNQDFLGPVKCHRHRRLWAR
jgi:hypothetical protein